MSKPNIEHVFTAFQRFHSRSVKISYRISSIREPLAWQAAMNENREELRKDFVLLNLEQHIDWEDKS